SPPSPTMMSLVSSTAPALRTTATTRAPARAMATATALPLPQPATDVPAPVTMAILPSRRPVMAIDALRRSGDTCSRAHPIRCPYRLMIQRRLDGADAFCAPDRLFDHFDYALGKPAGRLGEHERNAHVAVALLDIPDQSHLDDVDRP